MIIYVVIAVLAGAMLPLQAVFNARLGYALGSPLWAAAVSALVSALVLFILGAITTGTFPRTSSLPSLPLWAWFGGSLRCDDAGWRHGQSTAPGCRRDGRPGYRRAGGVFSGDRSFRSVRCSPSSHYSTTCHSSGSAVSRYCTFTTGIDYVCFYAPRCTRWF